MTVEEKLKNMIISAGGDLKHFCLKHGFPESTVREALKRESGITSLSAKKLHILCDVLNIDLKSLIEGEIKEKQVSGFALTQKEFNLINTYRNLDRFGIQAVDTILNIEKERNVFYENDIPFIFKPLPDLAVSAGLGNSISDYSEMVKIPKTKTSEYSDFVIRITGNSMEPEYSDNDFVLVKSQPNIDLFNIGIFILNGEGFIKQKGNGELISLNPDYKPITINEYDDIRCCGKVLGKTEIIK